MGVQEDDDDDDDKEKVVDDQDGEGWWLVFVHFLRVALDVGWSRRRGDNLDEA